MKATDLYNILVTQAGRPIYQLVKIDPPGHTAVATFHTEKDALDFLAWLKIVASKLPEET